MSNRRFSVLISVLLAGIVLSFVLGRLGNPLGSTVYRELEIPLDTLPSEMGEWSQEGPDRVLSQKVLEVAGMDRYLLRTYRSRERKMEVTLYLAYYGNRDRGLRTIYHNPTICLPRAGWEWLERNSRSRSVILTDSAEELPVRIDRFRRAGQERAVLNFHILDGVVGADALRNDPAKVGWAKLTPAIEPGYYMVAQIVPVRWEDDDDPAKIAVDFLKESGRYIRLRFPK